MGTRQDEVTPDSVRQRLQRVTATLPEDSYVLDESKDAVAIKGGKIFRLRAVSEDKPRAAATVYAGNDADEVLVEVGAASRFEIPIGGRWRPFGLESALDEVEALLRAVVEGRIRERVWLSADGIPKSEITVNIGDREFTGSTRLFGLTTRDATPNLIEFVPYPESRR